MCGRFTLKTPATVLIEHFALDGDAVRQLSLFQPRYNIAPTQDVAIIRHDETGARQAGWMRWGLIPSWTKELGSARPMINARSETAAEKPSFRSALRRRRCLIPADGFYEWQQRGRTKQPYYIRRPDEAPFALAGLWEVWSDQQSCPAGGDSANDRLKIESCTILTTSANAKLAQLHERMPVILTPGDYEVWLSREVQEPQELEQLFEPLPEDELEFDPVSTIVNKATNDDPRCVEIQTELF